VASSNACLPELCDCMEIYVVMHVPPEPLIMLQE
jgi:hypothetical protein